MKKLGRGVLRKLVRAVIVITGLFLVVFLTPKMLLYLQLRAARTEGLPIDPSDVVAQLSTSDSDNAAPIYLRAGDLLQKAIHQKRYFAPGEIYFARLPKSADIKRDSTLLKSYEPVLQVAELASLKPNLSYGRTWATSVNQTRPEFDSMRDFAILEVKNAGLRAEVGDQEGALRDIEAAERISYHAGSEPDFAADLNYCKTQMEINKTVTDVVSHVDRNPTFLKGLEALYEKLPNPRPLTYYCRGQFVMDRATLERLPQLTEDEYDQLLAGMLEEPRERMEKLLRNSFLNSIFEINLIGYYRNLTTTLPKDESDWNALQAATSAADTEANSNTIQAAATSALSKPMYIYARSQEGVIANRRLIQTAIMILEAKATDGTFPKEISQESSESINPFDSKPFSYSHDSQGFTLSGAGAVGATKPLALTMRPLGSEAPPRGKIAKAAA